MNFFIWLDQYTELIERFIQAQVVVAPLLLLFIEEMGVPIIVPGDAILGYTGYSISKTHGASLWFAFSVALLAVMLGATILFFAARKWGKRLVDKLGRFIFLEESHIERAETLFKRFGVWTIVFGRHVPGMRIPITIFAAISGIKYRTFILSTLASTVLWILFYLKIGKRYGGDIQHTIQKYAGLSLAILIAVILLIIGLHIWGAYKERSRSR